MRPIKAPLKLGDRGPEVTNLQDALQFLIERRAIIVPESDATSLVDRLRRDREQEFYGDGGTYPVIQLFQKQSGLAVTGNVDDATAAKLNEMLRPFGVLEDSNLFVVEGYVRRPDSNGIVGAVVSGVKVVAYDQDVEAPTELGNAVTDNDGKYRIAFTEEQFAEGDFGFSVPESLARILSHVTDAREAKRATSGPDLWVGIPREGDGYRAKSDIVFNAGRNVRIDLPLPDSETERDSELEEIVRLIWPRLKGLALHDLSDTQIDFLSKDAEIPLPQIKALVSAAKLVQTARGLAERNEADIGDLEFPLLAAGYAFERAEPGLSLSAVLGRGSVWWLEVFKTAIEQRRIPKSIEASADQLIDLLTRLRVWQRLEPADEQSAATLGDLLRAMPDHLRLKPEEQRSVSAILDKDPSDFGKLVSELEANGLARPRIHGVLRTVALGDLTLGHVPLVAELQQVEPGDRGAALLDLAAYGRKQWERLVESAGVPGHLNMSKPDDRKRIYVDQLLRNVELSMPSAYIAARIADNRIKLDAKAGKAVLKFFDNNPAFRFADDSVVGRFLEPDSINLSGIEENDIPIVRGELMRMERVAKVSHTLEVAEHMLAAGYGSARQVIHKSRDVFVDEAANGFPGGKAIAEKVYDNAMAAVATTTGLLLTYSPIFNRNPELPVMPALDNGDDTVTFRSNTPEDTATRNAQALTATLATLFGNQDYCECQSCASMYSPAAYLVELFQMLDSGPPNSAGKTALDLLLERRPDLAEIELTCDNSDVTLPYIDLVLEVLESPLASDGSLNRIARGQRDISGHITDWGFDSELDKGSVPTQLRADLRDVGIDLGDTPVAMALSPQPDKRWIVRGNGWRLHLNGFGNPAALRVVIYPQSMMGIAADEALPRWFEYLAYDALKNWRFPWTLPFDLPREETKAWLERLKVAKHTVVEAFAGEQRLSAVHPAAERLGISSSELEIITSGIVRFSTTEATISRSDWGSSDVNVNWLDRTYLPGGSNYRTDSNWAPSADNLLIAANLRRRARLTHRELLQLLETSFLRASPGLPNQDGRLELTGDECDSSRMFVPWLTASILRRLHLFIRLWRKLGWSVFDLDRAVRTHGNATAPATLTSPVADSSEERFTETLIVFLANIARLKELTNLSVEFIVNLFRTKLDTLRYWDHSGAQPRTVPSFYERLFYNPTVSRPRAEGLELNSTRDELRPLPAGRDFPKLRLSDYTIEIAAALSCKINDISVLLPTFSTSVAAVQIGKDGINSRDGDWIDLQGAEIRQVEWMAGQPSDAASQFRFTVQELASNGSAVDVGAPIVVTKGSNDWRRVVTSYAGPAKRIRVKIERIAGTGDLWTYARVLTSAGLVEDQLSLTNLTLLCRHIVLARALKIQSPDYVKFVQISGVNPLESSIQAIQFAEACRKSKSLGMSVAELDYVLRHRFQTDDDFKQMEQRITRILSTFRSRLQSEDATLSPAPGKAADLLSKLLVEVGWSDRLVDLVLGTDFLDKSFPTEYEADLESISPAVVNILPLNLSYDKSKKTLKWQALPRSAKSALSAAKSTLQATNEYNMLSPQDKSNIEKAFAVLETATEQTEQALTSLLDPLVKLTQSIELPTYLAKYSATASLSAASIVIPEEWSGVFWYEPAETAFKFRGPMTAEWKDALSGLANTPTGNDFRKTVDSLFQQALSYEEAGENRLVKRLGANPVARELTAELLLGDLLTLEDRAVRILERLVPAIRERRARAIATEVCANEFAISADQAGGLIAWFRHMDNGVQKALIARNSENGWLLMAAFAQSDAAVPISREAFPIHFDVIGRLAKLALIVARTGLERSEVKWLFTQWQSSSTLFDFSQLPMVRSASVPSNLWSQWLSFAVLIGGRKFGASSQKLDLDAIRIILSSNDADTDKIHSLGLPLDADPADLQSLFANLNVSPVSSLLNPLKLEQTMICLDLMRRTGADAATLHDWSQLNTSLNSAIRARQLARARIGEAQWATASRPVLDGLRMRRRDALTDYWVHKLNLRDANDLYGDLLIDPQMGPCMMTSRIRQAISSVQLFIHRALMNLEKDVQPNGINKTHWEWMKNYRVWEANRKVLFYPENWIEPELRRDKTSVFTDVEAQQSQADSTDSGSESLVNSYLSNLETVARLEIVSTCRETRDGGIEIIHVVGRTRSEPREYFYRSYSTAFDLDESQTGTWTPWTRITLDLDSVPIPYVFQSRLYLFWLSFTEKTDESAKAITDTATKPKKIWSTKLRWSIFDNGFWQAKKEVPFWQGGDPDPDYVPDKGYFAPEMFSLAARSTSSADVIYITLYGTRTRKDGLYDINCRLATFGFDGDTAKPLPSPEGVDDSLNPDSLYFDSTWDDPSAKYVYRFSAVHQIFAQYYSDEPV